MSDGLDALQWAADEAGDGDPSQSPAAGPAHRQWQNVNQWSFSETILSGLFRNSLFEG